MAVYLHGHLLIDKEEIMLKIRLQGTTRDIKWFFKILARDKRFYLHDPSDTFDIKGSRRFKRAYAQIFRDERDFNQSCQIRKEMKTVPDTMTQELCLGVRKQKQLTNNQRKGR